MLVLQLVTGLVAIPPDVSLQWMAASLSTPADEPAVRAVLSDRRTSWSQAEQPTCRSKPPSRPLRRGSLCGIGTARQGDTDFLPRWQHRVDRARSIAELWTA